MPERRPQDPPRIRTQRNAKGQLGAAGCDVVCRDTEQTNRAQDDRQRRESNEARGEQPPRGHAGRRRDGFAHGSRAVRRQVAVEPGHFFADRCDHVRVRTFASDDNDAAG